MIFYFYCIVKSKSNQIKSLLLSHHHSTSALVSEILMSVLQTVQKNNRQFTYGQTVQKNNKQFTYGQTVQKNNKQFTYGQTVQKNNKQFTYGQTVQKKQQQFTYGQTVQKTTAIYIWTVHIYRLYRRQCAKYTYIYSVRLVYYRDILNYQRHIIHRMRTYCLDHINSVDSSRYCILCYSHTDEGITFCATTAIQFFDSSVGRVEDCR